MLHNHSLISNPFLTTTQIISNKINNSNSNLLYWIHLRSNSLMIKWLSLKYSSSSMGYWMDKISSNWSKVASRQHFLTSSNQLYLQTKMESKCNSRINRSSTILHYQPTGLRTIFPITSQQTSFTNKLPNSKTNYSTNPVTINVQCHQ